MIATALRIESDTPSNPDERSRAARVTPASVVAERLEAVDANGHRIGRAAWTGAGFACAAVDAATGAVVESTEATLGTASAWLRRVAGPGARLL
ncbi:MAG: hypothetical protein ACF8PN_06735 [Phycisphaerales bacterium]